MKDLLAKLEAATEGSSSLDREVLFAVGWTIKERNYDHHSKGPYTHRHWVDPTGHMWTGMIADYDEPYSPTQSLDAAMTLIQPPWTRDVDATAPESGIDVGLHYPGIDGRTVVGTHNSEPIATVIAALRARGETA